MIEVETQIDNENFDTIDKIKKSIDILYKIAYNISKEYNENIEERM